MQSSIDSTLLESNRLSRHFINNCYLIGGWLLLVLISHAIRPIFFSSEILYTTVTWETWQHHHFILPIYKNHLYAEKGPLLFWLIQAGWALFGVSEWWVRLLHELFGLATLFLVKKLAQLLWPENKNLPYLSALILLGTFFFLIKISVFRFDIPVAFFAVLATICLVLATERHKIYWLYLSIVIALGLLAKGPVLFLFILPGAVMMHYWAKPIYPWRKIYLYLSGAILFSMLLSSLWLVAAVFQGGIHYADDLLLHRGLARIWNGDNSPQISYWRQNWFYYGYTLLLMLFPWTGWGTFWLSLRQFIKQWHSVKSDKKIALILITIVAVFILLTFIIEKTPRYILPALPFLAIFIAYILDRFAGTIKNIQPKLLAISYIVVGGAYTVLPFTSHLPLLHKFPWVENISPLWGISVIGIGVFLLAWKTQSLQKTVTRLCISTILLLCCINLGIIRAQSQFFNWENFANKVVQLQAEGYPIATLVGSSTLRFFGRMSKPLLTLTPDQVEQWIKQNPNGWLVAYNPKFSPKSLYLIPSIQYLSPEKGKETNHETI